MTSEVPEETSKKKKKDILYSDKLADRIANKLADGMSLLEISKYIWSPHHNTLLRWQSKNPYARERWFEARFTDAPIRLYDKLQELKNINLDQVAQSCTKVEGITNTMMEKLLVAKINHIYKERELVIRELEAYDPERWGRKGTQIDVNLNFKKEIEMKSLPELEQQLQQLGYEKKPTAIDAEFEEVKTDE